MKKILLSKGQAVLIVLLIMVVALTVGMSISLRSTKNIKLSTRTEESQRAFSAAEAGLEAALSGGGGVGTLSQAGDPQTVQYDAQKAYYGDGQEFIFPKKIAKDDTQQVWLVEHDPANNNAIIETAYYDTNSINICWGDSDLTGSDVPALEATLVYKDLGDNTYKIKKYAFDPGGRSNNFSTSFSNNNPIGGLQSDCSVGKYKTALDGFPGSSLYLAIRLRLIYNSAEQILVVKSNNSADNLPNQGEWYTSTGTVKIAGSDQAEMRTLNFHKSYPYLPGIFDFALFSGTAISK